MAELVLSPGRLHRPMGIFAISDIVYASNTYETHQLMRFSLFDDPTPTMVAGCGTRGLVDGPGNGASFRRPKGIAMDGEGAVLIADSANHCVRVVHVDARIDSRFVRSIAAAQGPPVSTLAGEGAAGFCDGTANEARFYLPSDVAVLPGGAVAVSDTGNNRVRLILHGMVTTVAGGSGTFGFADGNAACSSCLHPYGVAASADGAIIFADSSNHAVRRVDIERDQVSTVAGFGILGSNDGVGRAATFYLPRTLACDGAGRVVVGDHSGLLRVVDLESGKVRTLGAFCVECQLFRGGSHCDGCDRALATNVRNPVAVAIDERGGVLIADSTTGAVRRIPAALGAPVDSKWFTRPWRPTSECFRRESPPWTRRAVKAVLLIWVRHNLSEAHIPGLPLFVWMNVLGWIPRHTIGHFQE